MHVQEQIPEDTDEYSRPKSLIISWGCFLGGVESALLNRLRFMNATGFESHAYFYHRGAGLENFSTIPHHVSNQRRDLIGYLEQNQFDVVTFVNSLSNIALLDKANYKGKALFEIHGKTPGIVKALRFLNDFRDDGRITGIVVPSNTVARVAHRFLTKRTALPVFVARNTLDTEVFAPQPIAEFLDKWNIPPKWVASPLLGWVGRLEPNKNWRMLLRVFQRLRKLYKRMRILIAGDLTVSKEADAFRQAATEAGLRPGLDYLILANVPYAQMPYFYNVIGQSGGALLSTSVREGYPYHLLEAQACECPVVCSAIPASKEIVQHNETGLVFSLRDDSRAVKCLRRLLRHEALRTRLIHNARQTVCERNNIHSNVNEYIAWLGGLNE